MSKERALRREQRLAAQAAERAARARKRRRRQWRGRVLRRMVPRLPDRRTGRLLARRTRAQRAAVCVAVVGTLVLIWRYAPSLSIKIAFTLLTAVMAPVAVLLAFDRRI